MKPVLGYGFLDVGFGSKHRGPLNTRCVEICGKVRVFRGLIYLASRPRLLTRSTEVRASLAEQTARIVLDYGPCCTLDRKKKPKKRHSM